MAKSSDQRGFVYLATGERDTTLARRSARRLRAVHSRITIDLFTDQPVDDAIFAQIHSLDGSAHHPRIEVLRRSRFDDTILLQPNMICVTHIAELFGMTGRFPLSATLGTARPDMMITHQHDIPRWFPLWDDGLMVFRKGKTIQRVARQWDAMMETPADAPDLGALRRLCWDLRLTVGTVPPEYNVTMRRLLDIWPNTMGPPRMLHLDPEHFGQPGAADQPLSYSALLPADMVAAIDAMVATEASAAVQAEPLHWTRTSRWGRIMRIVGQHTGVMPPRSRP